MPVIRSRGKHLAISSAVSLDLCAPPSHQWARQSGGRPSETHGWRELARPDDECALNGASSKHRSGLAIGAHSLSHTLSHSPPVRAHVEKHVVVFPLRFHQRLELLPRRARLSLALRAPPPRIPSAPQTSTSHGDINSLQLQPPRPFWFDTTRSLGGKSKGGRAYLAGEADPRVRHAAVHGLVDVALALAVPHQNDAPREHALGPVLLQASEGRRVSEAKGGRNGCPAWFTLSSARLTRKKTRGSPRHCQTHCLAWAYFALMPV